MADLIQLRRGLSTFWTSTNPTLSEGEIGIETDTGLEKRGDGLTEWTSLGYFDKDNVGLSQVDNAKQQVWHGFPFPYEATLTYSAANRQFTLTPINGVSFDVWLNGVRHTKTGAQSTTAHANTTGNYYAYYDENGALQIGTTVWDIDGGATPVGYVYYSSALTDGLDLFELHTAKRNLAWHKSQHFSLGTYVKSGLEVSGFTLNTNTNAALTYAVASGVIVDEDIDWNVGPLADDGPYVILRRTGATDWTWTTNNSVPFLVEGSYIAYNQNNGGSFQMTEAVSARWVNYYLFATTAISANKRLLIVPSQTIHTSFSSAQAESVASIAWGGILIPEIVGVWKFTYHARNTYSTTGKVQLDEVSRLTLTRSQLSGNFTAGTHNALTGRDALDSHPASAITNTPAGNIAATDVQAAIDELDGEKLPNTTSLTDIGAALVDADEIPVYDASATGNRKSLLSRIWTYISGKLTATANTFTANQIISVADNTNAALRITQTGTGNCLVVEDSANPDATPFVIDASGKVLIGTTTSALDGIVLSSGLYPYAMFRSANDAVPPIFVTFKDRSGSIVQNNDGIARFDFRGYDGSAYYTAVRMTAENDGAPALNSMPGRLVFSTTADGSTTPTERLRINSSGNVGIGTTTISARTHIVSTTEQLRLGYDATKFVSNTVDANGSLAINPVGGVAINANSTIDALRITQTGTGNCLVVEDSANPDATPFVIDQYGSVVIGAQQRSSQTAMLELLSFSPANVMTIARGVNDTAGARIRFLKSRSTSSLNGGAIVSASDTLGLIGFLGDDGVSMIEGARIAAQVDDTPGENSMPGTLLFLTTASGATTPIEKMRINSSGNVGINKVAPDYKLDVVGTFGIRPGSSVTPINNGDVVFQLTSNTQLTIKAKGTDGTVRSVNLTLA